MPLPPPFLSYLRADGIILHPEPSAFSYETSDTDSGVFSGEDGSDTETEEDDPSTAWRDTHRAVQDTIAELGGKVVPKLNWSAPKDATWINATNSMECRTANDVYLLLKSSDFITHDLEHAFDDCEPDESITAAAIPYHLVLRKHFLLNPSVEFRCFVRRRKLIAICQRDLNHFDFLFKQRSAFKSLIEDFFKIRLRDTFADENFVFDMYLPPPHNKVWLVDINPWASRTDPLLFSWMELLTMDDPEENEMNSETDEDNVEDLDLGPEFRLVNRDDPEAYSFNTPQYSAHKMPKDVVDAGRGGESEMRQFAQNWEEMLAKRQQEEEDEDSEAD